MPEQFLVSVFNIAKLEVGSPVKVTIYGNSETVTYGYITNVCMAHIEIGAFNRENQPVVCVITPKQLLEEVVKIETL